MPRTTIVISGKVTRVGFRNFIKKRALELGLTGTVENTKDKTVEVVVEGSEQAIRRLVRFCARGPTRARPKNVRVYKLEPDTGEFTGFKILR